MIHEPTYQELASRYVSASSPYSAVKFFIYWSAQPGIYVGFEAVLESGGGQSNWIINHDLGIWTWSTDSANSQGVAYKDIFSSNGSLIGYFGGASIMNNEIYAIGGNFEKTDSGDFVPVTGYDRYAVNSVSITNKFEGDSINVNESNYLSQSPELPYVQDQSTSTVENIAIYEWLTYLEAIIPGGNLYSFATSFFAVQISNYYSDEGNGANIFNESAWAGNTYAPGNGYDSRFVFPSGYGQLTNSYGEVAYSFSIGDSILFQPSVGLFQSTNVSNAIMNQFAYTVSFGVTDGTWNLYSSSMTIPIYIGAANTEA